MWVAEHITKSCKVILRKDSEERHSPLSYLLRRSPLMRCYLLRVGSCGQPDGIQVELMLSLSTFHCMCVLCVRVPFHMWPRGLQFHLQLCNMAIKHGYIQVPDSRSFSSSSDLYSHQFFSTSCGSNSCGRNEKSAACLIGNRISLWARQPRQEITVNAKATAAGHRSGPFVYRLQLFQMLKTKETEASGECECGNIKSTRSAKLALSSWVELR